MEAAESQRGVRPEGRHLRVVESPEVASPVREIPLTPEGFLSLDSPEDQRNLVERAQDLTRKVESAGAAWLGDLKDAALHWRSLRKPRPEEVEAHEEVRARMLETLEPEDISFRDDDGRTLKIRAYVRGGQGRALINLTGLGGHPFNNYRQAISEILEDHPMVLIERAVVDKRNRHVVSRYTGHQARETATRGYQAVCEWAYENRLISGGAILTGHSYGGPHALRLLSESGERPWAERIDGVVTEQTNGHGLMAQDSSFGKTADLLRRLSEAALPIARAVERSSQRVEPRLNGPVTEVAKSIAFQELMKSIVSTRTVRFKVGNERVMDSLVMRASICAAKKQYGFGIFLDTWGTLHMHETPEMYGHDRPHLNVWGMDDPLLSPEASEYLLASLREHRPAGHDLIGDVAFPEGTHFVKGEVAHADAVSTLLQQMLRNPTRLVRALHEGSDHDPRETTPTWYYRAGKPAPLR